MTNVTYIEDFLKKDPPEQARVFEDPYVPPQAHPVKSVTVTIEDFKGDTYVGIGEDLFVAHQQAYQAMRDHNDE